MNSSNIGVSQYDATGTLVAEYPSATQAAKVLGKPSMQSHITKVCRGKRQMAFLSKWEYSRSLSKFFTKPSKENVIARDLDGNLVGVFKDERAAADLLGETVVTIRKAVRQNKLPAAGWFWSRFR